jgi:hypothetical protein
MVIFCLAGYAWVLYNVQAILSLSDDTVAGVCLIKHATSVPCPSCGSTKSVMAILQGQFRDAFFWNPMGFLLLPGLVLAPFWLSYDLILRKDTLLKSFRKAESIIRRRWVAIPAVLLFIANWIWNITKGF